MDSRLRSIIDRLAHIYFGSTGTLSVPCMDAMSVAMPVAIIMGSHRHLPKSIYIYIYLWSLWVYRYCKQSRPENVHGCLTLSEFPPLIYGAPRFLIDLTYQLATTLCTTGWCLGTALEPLVFRLGHLPALEKN